ncbi:MAG TPA: hypothetical protein PLQ76_05825 [bacterium]|nr:hypothetical protein [bacterium]
MKKIFTIIAAIMVIGTASAFAVEYPSQNVNFGFELPMLLDLSWASNGGTIDLTGDQAITTVEFLSGMREPIPGGVLSATSNTIYDITVMASALEFIGGTNKKPTSDLLVRMNFGPYVALNGTTEVEVLDAQAPEVDAWKEVEYMLLFSPDDTPGIYSTVLTYTIKPHI